MFYVYLLKNNSRRWYIGVTNNLKRRIAEHNSKQNFSTKYDPTWKIIYYEAYTNEAIAKEREKKLKNFGSAFGHLMKRIRLK